jgi:hypothetical protein
MPLRHSSGVLAIVLESDHRLQIRISLGSFVNILQRNYDTAKCSTSQIFIVVSTNLSSSLQKRH